jgi:predicted lipid-binding transport protein (Tim44 family)
MKLSWTSLKISVAGARLSHLVQKDKIWDHGSMVELVKNVFYKMEKATQRNDIEFMKRYVTKKAYSELMRIFETETDKLPFNNSMLTEVSIIEVKEKHNKTPDQFTALIKGKRRSGKGNSILNFSQRWQFVREGDWWLLDEMK